MYRDPVKPLSMSERAKVQEVETVHREGSHVRTGKPVHYEHTMPKKTPYNLKLNLGHSKRGNVMKIVAIAGYRGRWVCITREVQ